MPSQEEIVFEDLNFSTDRLSAVAREISLGVLAIVWALLVGENAVSVGITKEQLLGLAASSIITMLLDFSQYIAAYVSGRRAMGSGGLYKTKWWSYRIRFVCFYSKLVACVLTASSFLFVAGRAMV
jgi:hypothetical protein